MSDTQEPRVSILIVTAHEVDSMMGGVVPSISGDGGRYFYLPGAQTKADVVKALEAAGFKDGRFRDAVVRAGGGKVSI
ncbi:MAG: hypothetical protein OXG35_14130 [Acidobacteria bacterium]|nr:hypothetical protein [Acidobacteriota bacterium]